MASPTKRKGDPMRLRTKVAAAVFLGASLLPVGAVGAAQAADNSQAGGSVMRWVCDVTGGVYLGGEGVSYCFYRDGTIVACYRETARCVTYPPKTKAISNTAGLALTGGTQNVVSR
jgi:hypothetical protein